MAMALQTASTRRGSWTTPIAHALDSFIDVVSQWRQRALTRRELARLDDRMLHDIGISATDVESEVRKPFWKA